MKINILTLLLLMSFLQTSCKNNAQNTERVVDIPKNEQSKTYEPVNLIIYEIYDSVYSLCSKKFANLIKHPKEDLFLEIIRELNYADRYSESLLYNLVAANKLDIDEAKRGVAYCLTQSLSNPYIGKNSKEIALSYLKRGGFSTTFKRGKQIIERFESSSTDKAEFIIPAVTSKSTDIQRLKVGCLKGVADDYNKLRKLMLTHETYVFLLYYSYIMADRYNYLQAKKDVITIIKRFYREYNLGPIDKDTQYFCSYFD